MNIFDRLLTQPILNLLALIYNFVADFGVAIIILTILIRIMLWPLVKRQLHQTKLMRAIQPELKKIKKKSKGNRMMESQMMMELYRERGIKPFSSVLVLLIQLPIFFAIFRVVQIFSGAQYNTTNHTSPSEFIYPFLDGFGRIPELLAGGSTHLFGLIDLTKTASGYAPALILAIIAASLQFWQSKQIMPQPSEKKKLREMFRDAAAGKEVDQTEMAAATTSKMIYLFPVMTFLVALALPAAVTLNYATTSLVSIIQQGIVLKKDEEELMSIASEPNPKKKGAKKSNKAQEAEIIEMKPHKNKNKNIKSPTISSGGKTVVRRIKSK